MKTKFKDGNRVWLPENKKEHWPHEFGNVVKAEGKGGMYLVKVDIATAKGDDRIREVHGDHMRPIAEFKPTMVVSKGKKKKSALMPMLNKAELESLKLSIALGYKLSTVRKNVLTKPLVIKFAKLSATEKNFFLRLFEKYS